MTFEEKMKIMTSSEVSELIAFVSGFDEFSENFVQLSDSAYITMLKRLAEHFEAMKKKY